LHAAGDALSASLGDGEFLFLSRLLQVDPAAGFIVIACSDVKQANSALLAARSVTFGCNHEGTHYEFLAAEPRETQYRGVPAFQLAFPATMLALQRRLSARIPVPPKVPLQCEIRLGALSFDAKVIDISASGLGAVVYDPAIRLEVGMRLRTRIEHPRHAPVQAEMEVRHVSRVTSSAGQVSRAGCLFLGAPADIEDLIQLFITELGA
jgi:c-di-GMP-binding flagellar brake protein YcgR